MPSRRPACAIEASPVLLRQAVRATRLLTRKVGPDDPDRRLLANTRHSFRAAARQAALAGLKVMATPFMQ